MKIQLIMTFVFGLMGAMASWGAEPELYVYAEWKDGFVLVSDLIEEEETAPVYRDSRFCFKGPVRKVAQKIKDWNESGVFYSPNVGGGHVIEQMRVYERGIAGPMISLRLRSEVSGEVEARISIRACRQEDMQ